MQKIIVTDSTSDLDSSFLEAHHVHVIPLSVTINGKTYEDQKDISSESFVNYLEDDTNDLKTSQPPIGKFVEKYESLAKQGYEIISIHLSSGLSGTYQTALQASQMVDGKITVIDSKSISHGLGYQLKYLINWVEAGLPTEEIINKIAKLQKNIKLFVIIGQLDQLVKGGRISKTKGIIGNLIKIKPIGELVDGNLEMIHNARTQGACIKHIVNELSPFIGNDTVESVGISHANAPSFLEKIKEKLDDTFNIQHFDESSTTPVISTHTGTGAIGLVVLKNSTHI
ncbi:DegV family protein [Staphylococcus felis]|uniref:Fatty acid-binding protein DegV n=1 Tax=Staphylococcus felis TaxID=46127 RepID=A0A3E0IRE9_9STAP|nr:DegV family protein [Staphylococcus felis]REH84001.1 fatty acid-binding protein DegV [Staphylococcus felis]REH91876.1 fatty acid-binding protein DegV [Staphylococcus felis]REH98613.1 fatty acid-binding protein DegV [Staphylococcus felis]